MTEFLIPSRLIGNVTGISAAIAGLDKNEYDLLELALDGGDYHPLERDPDNFFTSKPFVFDGLKNGEI